MSPFGGGKGEDKKGPITLIEKQNVDKKYRTSGRTVSDYYRCIGIDVGSKRVGIARSDLLRTVANPVGTYPTPKVLDKLEDLMQNERVRKFVVGWPLTPEGKEGDATEGVARFINMLKARFPDIEVVKIDERYTSKEAVDVMIRAGRSQKERHRRGRIDQAAAAIILQKYLDRDE